MRGRGVGSGTGAHASPELLGRYAAGDAGLPPDALWAVEAHLEECAACRARLGEAVGRHASETSVLLERVRLELDAEVARSPRVPARRRWLPRRTARWATPTLLPWLGMTVLVVVAALGLDLASRSASERYPSLVLLLAPVAPLLGVAAAWSQGRDAAHELVAATPRAGLYLVLRRTLAVLAVVVPALTVAGWMVGTSPVRWLLPCLAFTVCALALGEVIALPRAAGGLGLLWAAAVVAPSLATARVPVVLEPASLPGWAGLTVVVAVVLVARRDAFTRLPRGR